MPEIRYGKGKTEYGPGVQIDLTSEEVAQAISAYLVSHDINVFGPRTITIGGKLCEDAEVYVDPSGKVIHEGMEISGRGCQLLL